MIGITFASLATTQSRQATAYAERTARLENAAKEAQDRVKDDSDEWELAAGEGGDGGSAVRLPRRDAEWEALGPIAGKPKKLVAKEKAVKERKRAEQGATSRLLASKVNGSTNGNGLKVKEQNEKAISSLNGNQNKDVSHSKPNAAWDTTPANPSGGQQENAEPAEKQELPSQFTERLAFLDMDDDEGGVSLVYK